MSLKRKVYYAIVLLFVISCMLVIAAFKGYTSFSSLSHEERGQLFYKTHFKGKAFNEYRLAYEADPSKINYHYFMINCLEGYPEYAIRYYTYCLAKAKKENNLLDQEMFKYCLGVAHTYKGNPEQALSYLQPMYSLTKHPYFLNALGKAYMLFLDKDKRREAKKLFMEAFETNCKYKEFNTQGNDYLYFNYVSLLLSLGDFPEAFALLEKNKYWMKDDLYFNYYYAKVNLANLRIFSFLKHYFLAHTFGKNVLFFLILALNSGIFWLFVVYYYDIFEPEPFYLIALAFFCGILSSLLVVAFQTFYPAFFNINKTISPLFKFIYAVFFVGFPEEGAKLIVLLALIYWNREFDEMIDGIIYAGAVALGFSAIENFDYIRYSGIHIYPGRAFIASFGHLTCTGIMGYFLSLSKFKKGPFKHPLLFGFILASLLHGIYDFFCFLGGWIGWFSLLILACEILTLVLLIRLAVRQSIYKEYIQQRRYLRRYRIVSAIIRYELFIVFFGLTLYLLWQFGFELLQVLTYKIMFAVMGSGIFLLFMKKPIKIPIEADGNIKIDM